MHKARALKEREDDVVRGVTRLEKVRTLGHRYMDEVTGPSSRDAPSRQETVPTGV